MVKFQWLEAYQKRFQEFKIRLTLALVLTLLEGLDGFVFYYDASRIGLGYVLMQHGKVIAYASKQLRVHKKSYQTNDLNCQKELNLCQRRWLQLLKDYDTSILCHPCKVNVVTDALCKLSIINVIHVEDEEKGSNL
ncbi:hypothetical protein MTR67_002515 [Solanum verrucosum]|uniref:Reverse transcriptase/retrotransposon-derived protein RNase H-like domain-containing protein n=1 Tax=Solanum verrucosum TaxID=315347 RepID=A0AAF0TDD0_SOLVR|nr:hypothetical protein MTR67_002515 [Solanum verrucosum]